MTFCRVLAISLCFIIVVASAAFAGEANRVQVDALVKSCVKLLQVGDFRGAALLYHYPPVSSDQQLADDIDGVEASLKIFAEEFGSFSGVVPLESDELYLNIYVSGGSNEYWGRQQNVDKIELRTDFEKFGPGYLVIQVADILAAPEIKAIAYGLPVSGQAAERIRIVGTRMLERSRASLPAQN